MRAGLIRKRHLLSEADSMVYRCRRSGLAEVTHIPFVPVLVPGHGRDRGLGRGAGILQ